MKKFYAMLLVLVMVFSFSAAALAAASPEVPVIEVEAASEESEKVLTAAVYEQLADKIPEGEVAVKVLSFKLDGEKKEPVAVKAAGVKKNDKVFILYVDKDGKIQTIEALVLEDGVIQFVPVGEGDYLIVKSVPEAEAEAANLIPRTGDSNRLLKLALLGAAAMSVMVLAGVAIKRSNNA